MSDSTPRTRPGTVTAAFVAWLVAVLFGLVVSVLLFVSAGSAVAIGESTLTADFFGITLVFAGVVVLVLTVIQAVIVPRVRVGRHWARVALTVLAVLQVFNAAFSILLNPAVSLIGITMQVVATVLMWLPASNRYFARLTTETP